MHGVCGRADKGIGIFKVRLTLVVAYESSLLGLHVSFIICQRLCRSGGGLSRRRGRTGGGCLTGLGVIGISLGSAYLALHLRHELFVPACVRLRNPSSYVQPVMDSVGCREGLPGHALPCAVSAGRIYHHLDCPWLLCGLCRYLPAHPHMAVRLGHVAGYAIPTPIDRLVVDVEVLGGEVQAVIVPWHLKAHEPGILFAPDRYLVIKVRNALVGDRDILQLHVQMIGWVVIILGPAFVTVCISLSCKYLIYRCHVCPLPLSCLMVIRLVVILWPFSRWPTTPILNVS